MSSRRLLFRHFLRQFLSFEGIGTGGELKQIVIAVVSLLAAPGYLTAVITARGGRVSAMADVAVDGRVVPADLRLWKPEWLLFTVSLVAVATLVAVQWRSLVLDGRDYRTLGVLPIRRRTVVLAKLQGLATVVLLLHLAINMLPGLWLPVASPFGYFRAALALQLALLMQTAFACGAVVAAQSVLGIILPGRVTRCVSAVLQAVLLLGVAMLFVAQGSISRLAHDMRGQTHPVNWLVPVVWFRALYAELLGVDSTPLKPEATLALVATVVVVVVVIACSLLGFRDTEPGGHAYGGGLAWLRLGVLLGRERTRPVARAVSSFVAKALFRTAGAGLVARSLLLVGIALAVSRLFGLSLRDLGQGAPTHALHAPAFLLPFFALVGLRLAAVLPTSVEANWIFRVTEAPGSTDYVAGVRSVALRAIVLPLLGSLSIPYTLIWGPLATVLHLALALAVALVTVEWLFLGFPKVPFTCTYQPGKANLRLTWPIYAAVLALYCLLLPALAPWAEARLVRWAVSVGGLLLAWAWLVRLRARQAAAGRLVFDDAAAPHVTVLGLQWREAADRTQASRS